MCWTYPEFLISILTSLLSVLLINFFHSCIQIFLIPRFIHFFVIIFVNSSFLSFPFPIPLHRVVLLFWSLFLNFFLSLFLFKIFIYFFFSVAVFASFLRPNYIHSNFGRNIDYCQDFLSFPPFLQASYDTHTYFTFHHTTNSSITHEEWHWRVLHCIAVGSRRLMSPDALQPKAYCTHPGL